MTYRLEPFEELVNALKIFPGIGTKTAERMALFLLKAPIEKTQYLSQVVLNVRKRIRFCSQCGLFTERDPCDICQDSRRDRSMICVIEEPKDVFNIERSASFRGIYHVLMGKISPLDGVGPENLEMDRLLEKVKTARPREVVIATGTDVEGEATALYILKLLESQETLVTRIAYGLPVGMGLDYADELTLARAMEARRSFS